MSKLMQVKNWRPAYVAMRSAGMKDQEIAELAGVSRAVVNGVATGNYGRKHSLLFNGGFRVLNKLKEMKANGQLPDFDFDCLRADEAGAQRPAGNAAGTGLGGAAEQGSGPTAHSSGG